YGAFEISRGVGPCHEEEVPTSELLDMAVGAHGRVYARGTTQGSNIVPVGAPEPDAEGRRPVGVLVDGVVRRGFPTPSGRLEFWSSTLAHWGWAEQALPGYIKSHVHPEVLDEGEMVLISTFRLPTQIHTRSANSKWLEELAHTNPLWLNPRDAQRLGVATGDLVRVDTAIGHFVLKAWVTEGIRPGVVACSHHMGRWRPKGETGARQAMAEVALKNEGHRWSMRRLGGLHPFSSADPDTSRLWWTDVGVHQNLTFPVHPDPVSGMHCWHQSVRVRPAGRDDAEGDIEVDTAKAHEAFRRWLAMTRPAGSVSPDGTRRPYWLMRPLRPRREAYMLEGDRP
ncbi:MAG: formate dehydrogenase, partial [Actinobacteria bacterium]|nr:formate dehydrogenase [Actinomycetota bacterium]